MENFSSAPSCWKRWKILEAQLQLPSSGKFYQPAQLMEKMENFSIGSTGRNWEGSRVEELEEIGNAGKIWKLDVIAGKNWEHLTKTEIRRNTSRNKI